MCVFSLFNAFVIYTIDDQMYHEAMHRGLELLLEIALYFR